MTDEEVEQLIQDNQRMHDELKKASEDPSDPNFVRAARWLSTLHRVIQYAIECRDNARRGR
jgi:hypothetical protein